MAEASNKKVNLSVNQDENFCVFNVLCVFISLVTILADLTTVILVFAEYCKDGEFIWAAVTFTFILVPNVLINAFSLRWFIIDQKSSLQRWITHGFLVGLLERYVLFLRKVFACQNLEGTKTQKLLAQRNDLSLLHVLYIFTGTIPQIIIQSYALTLLDRNYYTKVIALTVSNASVVWGCSTYIYSIMVFPNGKIQWPSFLLRLLWHFGMLLARILAILLFTVIFGTWTTLPLGICSMILYYRYFHSKGPIPWKFAHVDVELNNKITSTNSHANNQNNSGLKYVRSFKSAQKEKIQNTEVRNDKSEPILQIENENTDKKFLLEHWIARSGSPTFTSAPVGNTSINVSSIELYSFENTPQSVNTQNKVIKKITVCSPTELNLKLSSLENMESSIDEITSSNLQKRRGICSSDELRNDLTNINVENRIMISNAFNKIIKTEQGSEMSHDTDGSNKKTSSDSIDMDLDLSFSDINSSDINTFNENIVQKLCLSALKNIKGGNQDADIENIQKIALDILKEMYAKKDRNKTNLKSFSSKQRDLDTPTELLSVHDYENICAVNIAREAWGLRSWNGYCDIENWLHDGSVVRDRRRDTLTSASTEISSCVSQELKNSIMTAPPFPKKSPTYSNVFVKFDKSFQDDYANSASCHMNDETYLAKPCITDTNKDPNHLEPILEELDDLGDVDPINKKRLNSESSLVATIDEIRKATVTNSPRNLYHRTDIWESPQFNSSAKLESNLKRALWKEPSKFNSSNIMESLPEKENILNEHSSKFDINKKELNLIAASSSLDLDNPESVSIYNKNTKRRQKTNLINIKNHNKKSNWRSEPHLQDLSNKHIDFLWQLVSENSVPMSSNDDLSTNRRTSSLQSLIQKDVPLTQDNTQSSKPNAKKGVKSRPRRKFSILRERFEPKMNFNSDEEILYSYSDSTSKQGNANFVNIKNQFNVNDKTRTEAQNVSANLSNVDTRATDSDMSRSIKEKRTLFMKQVLSPPKFNTKLRYKV
ncbi:uncharacterized protein LOC113230832 isoform X2 [Hyposmocoma kahamanoa]|uniref:uncharacterized protein LOC113230832 isoform X2 n=1 Tax=Hyposmocoma kahamanoa TaxID=1477025 RepID=UPI000E6D87B9|nr:uncharacterized protein LOC113230832 isoform X2 [Hyposmocoma kahamanoa]